jgi:hypothetical protein
MPKGRRIDGAPARAAPIMAVRGVPAWADWLRRLAEHASMPQTLLVDQALKHYARSIYFDEPMPRRLPAPAGARGGRRTRGGD